MSHAYVIHEHHARNLHWDLRLEYNGALKSWALPKEPPMEPGIKRLAVEVEDHRLDYADFEGTIPEGEYGAGEVRIWDRGRYKSVDEADGKHVIEIEGKKLRGKYSLIRTKMGGTGKNWLFFKNEQAG